jgi:hypothetical protein
VWFLDGAGLEHEHLWPEGVRDYQHD